MYLGIKMEAIYSIPIIKIIGGVVLATRRHLKPVPDSGAALQPLHVAGGVFSRQRRIFARRLLPSSPPRVPKNVYIRAPIS